MTPYEYGKWTRVEDKPGHYRLKANCKTNWYKGHLDTKPGIWPGRPRWWGETFWEYTDGQVTETNEGRL